MLIDMLLPNKKAREIAFEMAINSSNAISNAFKLYKEGDFKTALDQSTFTMIFPNDVKSPAIYWISDSQYIIKYPENSRPYIHNFKEKCKFIECLSGKILDKNSSKKLFKGDRIKVQPTDNFETYTLDEPCYLRVCISECDSLLDQVCG